MNTFRCSLLAALFAASSAHAADGGLLIKMQLRENDRDIAAPSMLVAPGQPGTLQLEDRIRIELLADESNGKADLRFKLFVNTGRGLEVAGAPRIVVETGQTSSLAWGKDGQSFTLTVKPTKVPLPSKS